MRFGLTLPHYGFSLPGGAPITFEAVADSAIRAERLGFDSVWISDHFFYSFGRYGADPAPIASIEPLIGRRIFLSEAPADKVDDLSSILAGVAVGLAFYEPDYRSFHTGRNLKYLGLASGKISTYLRYGIPVILNEIGLYADEARRHGFGRVVAAPEDIGPNLAACLGEDLGRRARAYFRDKLDFNLFREQLWARLSDLMDGHRPTS